MNIIKNWLVESLIWQIHHAILLLLSHKLVRQVPDYQINQGLSVFHYDKFSLSI